MVSNTTWSQQKESIAQSDDRRPGHCSQQVQPEMDTAGACMQQGRRRDGAKQGQVSLSLSLPTYTWNVHLYFKPPKELQ